MLSDNQKAAALNYAMRYDVMGYECPEFKRFNRFLLKHPKLRGDVMNFYRALSPMTQRTYLALIYKKDPVERAKKFAIWILEQIIIFLLFGGGAVILFYLLGA